MQLGRHAHRVLAEPSTRNDPTLRESLGGKARAAFGACVRTVRQAQINVPDYEEHNQADPLDFLREDRNVAFVPEGALGDPEMPVALFGRLLDTWRGAWQDPSLPFLTCSRPPSRPACTGAAPTGPDCGHSSSNPPTAWPMYPWRCCRTLGWRGTSPAVQAAGS